MTATLTLGVNIMDCRSSMQMKLRTRGYLDEMKLRTRGYLDVLSSKLAGSKIVDQWLVRHLEFQNGRHNKG